MNIKAHLYIITLLLFTSSLFSQEQLLQSGPMVGYSAYREVGLWVQTTKSATVHFEYYDLDSPSKVYQSDKLTTAKSEGFTAKIPIEFLEPGKKYGYSVFINGKKIEIGHKLQFQTKELWQWRKNPPDFSFVSGSCFYVNEPVYDRPGTPYGDEPITIFNSILSKSPDFMVWLGDNTYLREADWDSRSGIYHRYTHDRSVKELQPLLGSVHHYAIWDDHEYGINDASRTYQLKDVTLKAFNDFWFNPIPGTPERGISHTFQWSDAEFFMLDNRWFKVEKEMNDSSYKTILGKEQIDWFIESLSQSLATFKFVAIGGQFISNSAAYENYAVLPVERQMIIDRIVENGITGVIFLTGDRHFSEVSVEKPEGFYPIYDFTISPFTSGAGGPRTETNTKRIAGSLIERTRNFAKFNIVGEKKERKIQVEYFNAKGESLYKMEIKAEELKPVK